MRLAEELRLKKSDSHTFSEWLSLIVDWLLSIAN